MSPETRLGIHWILELFDCDRQRLDDLPTVEQGLELFSERGGLTVLQVATHKFAPQGVTAVGLLSESHVSIHTWPENGYAAIDVFTCGKDERFAEACRFLAEHFEAGRRELVVVSRGELHRESGVRTEPREL